MVHLCWLVRISLYSLLVTFRLAKAQQALIGAIRGIEIGDNLQSATNLGDVLLAQASYSRSVAKSSAGKPYYGYGGYPSRYPGSSYDLHYVARKYAYGGYEVPASGYSKEYSRGQNPVKKSMDFQTSAEHEMGGPSIDYNLNPSNRPNQANRAYDSHYQEALPVHERRRGPYHDLDHGRNPDPYPASLQRSWTAG